MTARPDAGGNTASSASALYSGVVAHQRLRPMRHRLRYRVFSLLVDLDELPALAARLRWLSLNRFNLFSIHLADHGAGEAAGPRAHVERQLRTAGLLTGGAIRLLAMPRILGYAFNPLSVYFCHHPDGRLQAILYEVNNTFGERHSYLIAVAGDKALDDGGALIRQRCDKKMHVSPFLGLDMHYEFRIRPPGEALSIGVHAHDAQGPVLVAQFDAKRQSLTDPALLRAFATHPLLTLKVIAAIHWEALRLWLKGATLYRKPAPPVQDVTVVHRTQVPIHSVQPDAPDRAAPQT